MFSSLLRSPFQKAAERSAPSQPTPRTPSLQRQAGGYSVCGRKASRGRVSLLWRRGRAGPPVLSLVCGSPAAEGDRVLPSTRRGRRRPGKAPARLALSDLLGRPARPCQRLGRDGDGGRRGFPGRRRSDTLDVVSPRHAAAGRIRSGRVHQASVQARLASVIFARRTRLRSTPWRFFFAAHTRSRKAGQRKPELSATIMSASL